MKHLLNGVAIAAALAIAAPALAQAPASPPSAAPKSAAAAPAQKHKSMGHHRMSRRAAAAPSMTQQLNQAEMARHMGAGPTTSTPMLAPGESTRPASIGAPKQP